MKFQHLCRVQKFLPLFSTTNCKKMDFLIRRTKRRIKISKRNDLFCFISRFFFQFTYCCLLCYFPRVYQSSRKLRLLQADWITIFLQRNNIFSMKRKNTYSFNHFKIIIRSDLIFHPYFILYKCKATQLYFL